MNYPSTPKNEFYDRSVLRAATQVSKEALDDFFSSNGRERAIVVSAPAGAGKTELIVDAVGKIRGRKTRLAAATPTNEQAFGLVRRLAIAYPQETISFVPARDIELPPTIQRLPNVQEVSAAQTVGRGVIVGTLSKLGDAFARGDLSSTDALLIDESYQADSSRYYGVGGLAPIHLLVGDCGQLNPFSTIDDPDHWRGLPEDPLQTAVGVLLRNHPSTRVHKLPLSRRLDPRAAKVAQAFYPDLPFSSALNPAVRGMRLLPMTSVRPRERLLDGVLDRAAVEGWAHIELPDAPVLTADPEIVELIAHLFQRLAQRTPQVRCELSTSWQDLRSQRVAVGVSHNDQKDVLRARLDALGYGDVVVDTANKLQGLEFDVVIAWHPLAGLPDPDAFHLDPGRLCVLLTRHRHACIIVGRSGDRKLLNAIPPRTPAYLGWDPDPVYDGWGVHEAVFAATERFRISA